MLYKATDESPSAPCQDAGQLGNDAGPMRWISGTTALMLEATCCPFSSPHPLALALSNQGRLRALSDVAQSQEPSHTG